MTVRHWNKAEIADYIGRRRETIYRYKLPPADVQVGPNLLGYLPATVKAWHRRRPGRGNWSGRQNWELPRGPVREPVRHLSRTEFAAEVGVPRGSFWSLEAPDPDVTVGPDRAGWLPETVQKCKQDWAENGLPWKKQESS